MKTQLVVAVLVLVGLSAAARDLRSYTATPSVGAVYNNGMLEPGWTSW